MEVYIVYYNSGISKQQCLGIFTNKQLAENKIKVAIGADTSFEDYGDDRMIE
jgi:hypothetical protein